MSEWAESPFIVPIGAFLAWFGVVAVKTISSYKVRKLRSQERLAAIEKGLPLPPDEPSVEEKALEQQANRPASVGRRIIYLRTGGIVCTATGIGIVLFFMALAHIVENRLVLCGAATGIIPLAIGAGLLLDARIQAKALAEEKAAAAVPPPPPPVMPEYPQQ